MKEAQDRPIVAFETAQALDAWLEEHGASSPGIYIKIAKKDSGILSVNYAEALDYFQKLTELAPENAHYHYHLGRNLLELQRVDEAVDSLSRSLTEDPQHVDSYLVLSRALSLANQSGDAEELLEMGLKLMPRQNHLANELSNLRLRRGHADIRVERSKAASLARVRSKIQEALMLAALNYR